jgi:hypothetical protein
LQLSETYTVWQHKVEQAGNVTFLLGHEVIRIVSRSKKQTMLGFRIPSSDELRTAEFDSLILATDADSALTILGKEATWMERRVLGGVKYLHDLTVTHMDTDYMRKVSILSHSSQRILTQQRPSSTMRLSSDLSSSLRVQPKTSAGGARPTFGRSITPINTRPRSRSWRCLLTSHFTNLNCLRLMGSITSTKQSFSTKMGLANFGQRVKSRKTRPLVRSGGSSRATDGNTTRVSSLGCGQ